MSVTSTSPACTWSMRNLMSHDADRAGADLHDAAAASLVPEP
jgi:hypothetical protein